MSIVLWIVVVILTVGIARAPLRRLAGRRLSGRTLHWRVVLRRSGQLTARGWRLRLYGIAPFDDDATLAIAFLRAAIAVRSVRLRVVAIDSDGTLVVVMRCNGQSQAWALLRAGLAQTLGTGARAHRHAQDLAQCERRGLWSGTDCPQSRLVCSAPKQTAILRWWQC